MPLHDWTPGREWAFWDLRTRLQARLTEWLNAGCLPAGHCCLVDVRHRRNDRPERRNAVYRWAGRVRVAGFEVVSPRDKQSRCRLGLLAKRVQELLADGASVTLIDLLPPARYDRRGTAHAVADRLGLPAAGRPLAAAVFDPADPPAVRWYPAAVGEPLPVVPVLLPGGRDVPVPVEDLYQPGYDVYPPVVRQMLGFEAAT